MSQAITPVKVDNVTIEKSSSQELRTIAGAVVKYSDARFKTITFVRNLTADNGNVNYVGLGFTPKALILLAAIDGSISASWILSDVTTPKQLLYDYGLSYSSFSNISYCGSSAGNYQAVTLVSMDADGFTLNFVKTGAPTGLIVFSCLALR